MGSIFTVLVGEQFAGALLFFSIAWLTMRKKDGQKLNIGILWLIGGLFATAIGAGAIRFMAIFVIGGKAALNPEGGLGVFFYLALPIIIAIAVCTFLRTKASPASTTTNG
jgi:hypothetical protein